MVKYWVSTEKSVKVSCECENQDARYTKGYYASCNIRRPLEWKCSKQSRIHSVIFWILTIPVLILNV